MVETFFLPITGGWPVGPSVAPPLSASNSADFLLLAASLSANAKPLRFRRLILDSDSLSKFPNVISREIRLWLIACHATPRLFQSNKYFSKITRSIFRAIHSGGLFSPLARSSNWIWNLYKQFLHFELLKFQGWLFRFCKFYFVWIFEPH